MTRLPQFSLYESDREKVHDNKGNQLSVRKGQKWVYKYIFLGYLQLTSGIADDARIPSSEGIMIERHRALLEVGDGEESYFIYLARS